MDDKDITKFFEDLTPHQFTSTDGAYRVEHFSNTLDSFEDMNHFFNACIDGTRLYYELASQLAEVPKGRFFIPFAIVHSANERRYYRARDGDTNRNFYDRVKTDIADLRALWLYTAVEATAFIGHTGLDASTPKKTEKLKEKYPHQDSINWYFESVQPGAKQILYGAISVDGDTTQLVYTAKSEGGESPLFTSILDAHRN